LIALSYLSWRACVSVFLVIVMLGGGAALAAVRAVRFSGHMWPTVIWRWTPLNDDRLEEHRRAHAGAVREPVQLGSRAMDFPEYRGQNRDGVARGPALARDWQAHPPRLLWRQPVGGGYAAFAVADNLAVTIEQRRDNEAIVGYDTASGGERWTYSYPALFSESMGGIGPRATPTLKDGRVYSLGANGKLVCLDAATGKLQWQTDILESNSNLNWGMCSSPLVYDHFVVVSPGKQGPGGHTLVAYDRGTGSKVWAVGEARGGYSSPMLATLAGVRQVLMFDGQGIAGYDPATGRQLWRRDWATNQDINVAQPLVLEGDRVFVTSGYGVGCALLHVTCSKDGKWDAQPLWPNSPLRTMRCKFTSPVAYQGHVYGLDEGILVCLDEKTGKRRWREGRYGHGQLLLAGDLLVIMAETGELALVEASPSAYRELGRIRVFEGKTWNYPALADGKVYLRNDEDMVCYDLTAAGQP
jgi:outer membrane protein assembly factor BamB